MKYEHVDNWSVLGMARSGQSAAELLARHGFAVSVADRDPDRVSAWLDGVSGEAWTGCVTPVGEKDIHRAGVLVVSPGIPLDAAPVVAARAAGSVVMGEVELAWHFCDATLVGVTGTNGKTTTVGIVGDVLRESGYNVVVAGNVGRPFTSVVDGGYEVVVLELSSFQLDTLHDLRLRVAALLNVTPDHLDRYHNRFGEYAASKKRILLNADSSTHFVYNRADETGRALAGTHTGTARSFGFDAPSGDGVTIDDGWFTDVRDGRAQRLVQRDRFAPIGLHNEENAMAAIAIVDAFDVEEDALVRALEGYRPKAHRMELVRRLDGVDWVNDSKATNVAATLRSVESATGQVVVILGGRDKQGDFSVLEGVHDRIRAAVLIGEAADTIASALGPRWRVVRSQSMEDAVGACRGVAKRGDTVLLAPACASFDMFRDYQHRGDVFRECVCGLEARA